MSNYDDIIDHEHHVSKNHPQMPMEARAGQFAPFSALNGHSRALAKALEQHVAEQNASPYDEDWEKPEAFTEAEQRGGSGAI